MGHYSWFIGARNFAEQSKINWDAVDTEILFKNKVSKGRKGQRAKGPKGPKGPRPKTNKIDSFLSRYYKS